MTADTRIGLVSVIVASYNHAEYLSRRMDSLLAQTHVPIEIIVIEDCSTDTSLDVLRPYARDARVKLVVRQSNGGWVAVSNQGIDLASGEFVLFANCDDACEPRMIERLVDALREHPSAAIAFCRCLFVDEHDHVLGQDIDTRESEFRRVCAGDALIDSAKMSRFLLHSCVIPNLSAALFRKECFGKVGNLSGSYRVCSDWDLFFRMAARYDVAYVSDPLNLFRQHATTIRSTTKERIVNDEYLRLLLGQIRALDLSVVERCRFRTHAMYLWAVHLISPSWSGLRNFPYHFRRVAELDPLALPFLIPGAALRAASVLGKALGLLPRAAGDGAR